MENALLEIISSDMKHKEQVEVMTAMAGSDQTALAELFDMLKNGTDVQKGTAAEVMKFVSKEKPVVMVPYIGTLIDYIDYNAPRVRWGCPEAIGNLAPKYPHEVERAIPKLLGNLNDKSTVVRWCAAFALTEIAKYNLEKQDELVVIIRHLITVEQNNGVKNVYIKALKEIEKR
jgi:hypothetical protein